MVIDLNFSEPLEISRFVSNIKKVNPLFSQISILKSPLCRMVTSWSNQT